MADAEVNVTLRVINRVAAQRFVSRQGQRAHDELTSYEAAHQAGGVGWEAMQDREQLRREWAELRLPHPSTSHVRQAFKDETLASKLPSPEQEWHGHVLPAAEETFARVLMVPFLREPPLWLQITSPADMPPLSFVQIGINKVRKVDLRTRDWWEEWDLDGAEAALARSRP